MSDTPGDARKVGLEHMAASGLTAEHAVKLGVEFLSASRVEALIRAAGAKRPFAAMAMRFPYFSPSGKQTEFYRLRFLKQLPGFAGQLAKFRRYWQPPRSLCEVYLAPLLDRPWEEVAKDPKLPLYITEGEKKAARACALGLPCIGLGGVDSWSQKSRGLDLLPMLADIDWRDRPVTIIYDSDAAEKQAMQNSQRRLAERLTREGAAPSLVILPPGPNGEKQGLDDLIVNTERAGGDPLAAIDELVESAEPYGAAVALFEMNEKAALVSSLSKIVELKTGRYLSLFNFQKGNFAHCMHSEPVGLKGATKLVSTADRWLKWPGRTVLDRPVFDPTLKPGVADGLWNEFPGWPIQPVPGPYQWWTRHAEIVCAREKGIARGLIRWFAFLLQHPGESAPGVIVFSSEPGTGKSSLAYPFTGCQRPPKSVGIYGDNAIVLDSKAFDGDFNSHFARKLFVLGEEMFASDSQASRQRNVAFFKNAITKDTLQINEKYVPHYTVPNLLNYYLTSNRDNAVVLDTADRRWTVIEAPDKKLDRAYTDSYFKALRDPACIAGLYHYLLNLDVSDFDPHEPLVTMAKARMVDASGSSLDVFIRDLDRDPESALLTTRIFSDEACRRAPLWSTAQLLRAAHQIYPKLDLDPHYFGRVLKRNFVRAVRDGAQIRSPRSCARPYKTILYVLRDHDNWLNAAESSCWRQWASDFPDEVVKLTRPVDLHDVKTYLAR